MKNCSKCMIQKPLINFRRNDYDRPVSQCKECESIKSLSNYYKRKNNNPTIGLENNSSEEKIICKDFTFYEVS